MYSIIKAWWVVLLAFIITSIITWPFILNIGSYSTDQGDYVLAGSNLWYNQESLKTGKIFNSEEYFQGYQFYPHPKSLLFSNNSLAPVIFFGPLYWISGNFVFSVNTYAFLTLVLSFVFAYYAIYYFVRNPYAACVGAFIFAFNPNTMVRFPQHLDILGKYWLPLLFVLAYRLMDKPAWKTSIFFFLVFTLNALTISYFQIFSLVLLPLAALPFVWMHIRKRNWQYFLSLIKVSTVGLVFLPVVLYFQLPYLEFSQSEGAYRSLDSTAFFSARLTDWFTASPDNLFYGAWVKSIDYIRTPKDDRGILNYEEHTLFVGVTAFILFAIGMRFWKQEKLKRWFFIILLILPFIFTFGPYWEGKVGGFPLPFYALYKIFPLMEGIRSPTRFEFMMMIPFALIAAYGVKSLIMKKS